MKQSCLALSILAASIFMASCSSHKEEKPNLNLSDLQLMETDTIIVSQSNDLWSLILIDSYACSNEFNTESIKKWTLPFDFDNVKKGDMFIFKDGKDIEMSRLKMVKDIIRDYDIKAHPVCS